VCGLVYVCGMCLWCGVRGVYVLCLCVCDVWCGGWCVCVWYVRVVWCV